MEIRSACLESISRPKYSDTRAVVERDFVLDAPLSPESALESDLAGRPVASLDMMIVRDGVKSSFDDFSRVKDSVELVIGGVIFLGAHNNISPVPAELLLLFIFHCSLDGVCVFAADAGILYLCILDTASHASKHAWLLERSARRSHLLAFTSSLAI